MRPPNFTTFFYFVKTVTIFCSLLEKYSDITVRPQFLSPGSASNSKLYFRAPLHVPNR